MWGNGSFGEIGCGSGTHSITPKKIMDNVRTVCLGSYYSAVITTDGSLYTVGCNVNGQLGNGTTKNSYYLTKIMSNVRTVNLGYYHSAAITTDGSLYMWGYNKSGEIGNGTTTNINTPIKIMNDIRTVSLGQHYSAAITTDGSLYMWGYNGQGELGDGTTTSSFTPILINNTRFLSATRKTTDTEISVSNVDKTIAVASSSISMKTATFRGYTANATYNFYSLKSQNVENPLASDNILYIDQLTADKNGSITVNYYPTQNYTTPCEFVTSLTRTEMEDTTIKIPTMTYNASSQKVLPTITYNAETLVEGTDYEISGITNPINAGEYVVIISGKGDFVGKVTVTYTILCKDVSTLDIKHQTKVDYIGSQLTPAVVVTDGDKTLEENTDYTIAYTNNTNVGTGKITITGIGNYAGEKESTFEIIGTGTEQPTTNNYYVTGDIEMKLSTCGTYKVNGKIALQAGTYKIKLNNNGTLLGYGKTVTDSTGGLTFKSTFNSYMTLKATGGVYTFQVNTDTNALVIKHDSNLPTEYLTGDLNTILIPVKGRTLSIGTTYLEAGTYNFKLSIDGVAFGYGKTVNDKTTGSLSTSNKFSSNITLVATGGTYTFTLNTSTNKLIINHIPAKDEATDNIHLSGDFDLILNDNGGSNNIAVGTVALKEATYSFKLYNYGQALTAGVKITDKGTKTLYGNYTTPVTLIASGGTYKFSFNKTTNVLTVEKV